MNQSTAVSILCLAFCLMACGSESPKKPTKKAAKKELSKKAESTTATTKSEEKKTEKKQEKVPEVIYKPEELKKADELISNASKSELAEIDAKKKFKMLCATCHGFKGNANINGAKDLTKSEISLQKSIAQIYHGRGLMTPFKGILTDDEIVAVAKYSETLRK